MHCSSSWAEPLPTEPPSARTGRSHPPSKLRGVTVSKATPVVTSTVTFQSPHLENETRGLDDQSVTFFPSLVICDSPFHLRLLTGQQL